MPSPWASYSFYWIVKFCQNLSYTILKIGRNNSIHRLAKTNNIYKLLYSRHKYCSNNCYRIKKEIWFCHYRKTFQVNSHVLIYEFYDTYETHVSFFTSRILSHSRFPRVWTYVNYNVWLLGTFDKLKQE